IDRPRGPGTAKDAGMARNRLRRLLERRHLSGVRPDFQQLLRHLLLDSLVCAVARAGILRPGRLPAAVPALPNGFPHPERLGDGVRRTHVVARSLDEANGAVLLADPGGCVPHLVSLLAATAPTATSAAGNGDGREAPGGCRLTDSPFAADGVSCTG